MFERNDFVTPTLGGANWFEKPALLYWLQIVFYKLFGVSEFAARFGSAVFGLLTIFSLWILGRFLTTETQKNRGNQKTKTVDKKLNTDFANWLALIAASSIGLIVFSRGASFDIVLTFPITASLVAFFIFDQSSKKSFTTYHLPLFTFYFFIGVSLLAKGLVGIVFPFAIVAFYYLLRRKMPNKTFVFSLFWGTVLSLLTASVWYVPMYLRHGWMFIDEFFIQHHFQRFSSDKYQHAQPFWFFWLVLPLMTLPWLPFFLASIWDFIKVQSSKFKVQSKFSLLPFSSSPLLLFSLSWLLVPLIFFSLSGSKLPGYILPALPAALILTAQSVFRFIQKSPPRKFALQFFAFLIFGVTVFLLQFIVPRYAEQDSVKNLIETADANGFANEKVVNLYVVSHNAEFYAAKRLVRDGTGKLKRYDDFSELVNELKRENLPQILVLVPTHALENVTESESVEARVLGENSETTIVLIKPKN